MAGGLSFSATFPDPSLLPGNYHITLHSEDYVLTTAQQLRIFGLVSVMTFHGMMVVIGI